jgi:hypothetical protein
MHGRARKYRVKKYKRPGRIHGRGLKAGDAIYGSKCQWRNAWHMMAEHENTGLKSTRGLWRNAWQIMR